MHLRSTLVFLLCAIASLGQASAWTSPAPDVVLDCPPALERALGQVAARYTAAAHVKVHIFTGASYRLQGLLKHRARDDVVVADALAIQAWAATGLVRPASIIAVGRNPYILVARTDAAWPETDPAKLLANHQAVLTDPTTTAEFDGAAILHAALPDATIHSIGVADTPTVLDRVRADGALLGVVPASDADAPLIHKITALAAPPTPLAGALVTEGQSGNAASLLAYIAGPDGQAILRQSGVETAP